MTALRQIWRLSAPYFRSEEKWAAWGLLLVIVAIEFGQTFANVRLNVWTRSFNNALQMRDVHAWVSELWVFVAIGCSLVFLLVGQLFMNQWLQIRWRRWMTSRYLSNWLRSSNHYRLQLKDTTDNPDQRISIDIAMFITNGLTIAVGLLGALITLFSFIFILWNISARTPLPIMGHNYAFPGYLVVAALAIAGIGTLITHFVGRELIPLNFNQQRFEADFRFGLVRVRENSEQIALLKGEDAEEQTLMNSFHAIVRNWYRIMMRSMKLSFANASVGQFMFVVPFLLIGPSILSGQATFGDYFQTSLAFGTVQGSFAFFITNYRNLAEWKAVIDRLIGFEFATDEAVEQAKIEDRIERATGDATGAVEIEGLDLRLPDGRPLVEGGRLAIQRGERVLVSGPSGAGKSTILRALGGIWPFGSGRITIPANARAMIIPQKPYLPIGSLRDAIAFPQSGDAWDRREIEMVIKDVGLGALIPRLDEPGHWSQVLSLGEQQRVAIARALLHKPDLLFLDEATASLDEPAEAQLYGLLRERLADATIISIGHRSALRTMHDRRLLLVKEGGLSRLVEDVGSAAGPPISPDLGVV